MAKIEQCMMVYYSVMFAVVNLIECFIGYVGIIVHVRSIYHGSFVLKETEFILL